MFITQMCKYIKFNDKPKRIGGTVENFLFCEHIDWQEEASHFHNFQQ